MPIDLVFPSDLPGPRAAPIQPADRRALEPIEPGPFTARAVERDRRGTQDVTFPAYTGEQMARFEAWWRDILIFGGAWFSAYWPMPEGRRVYASRRFLKGVYKAEFIGAIGTGFWRITATFEIRGRGRPPLQYPELLLGLHFDGSLHDESGHSVYRSAVFIGTNPLTFPTTGQKFGSAAVHNPELQEIAYSDNRGSLAVGTEYQISVWVKLYTSIIYGSAGGAVLDLGSWAVPNGGDVSTGDFPPMPPTTGQFALTVQAGAPGSTISVRFDYPFIDPPNGKVYSNTLRPFAIPAAMPTHDGEWHHIGIAADATSVRAYVDGLLVQDDGDYSIPRAAGLRPPYTQSTWVNQRFLLFARAAGSGDYSIYPENAAFALQFHGDVDDLAVWAGPGSATFVGTDITAQLAAPFKKS